MKNINMKPNWKIEHNDSGKGQNILVINRELSNLVSLYYFYHEQFARENQNHYGAVGLWKPKNIKQ